jgi:hypothetical protein
MTEEVITKEIVYGRSSRPSEGHAVELTNLVATHFAARTGMKAAYVQLVWS